MNITLHWWIVPIFFVILAVADAWRGPDNDYDFFWLLRAPGWLAIAIAVIVGHFL